MDDPLNPPGVPSSEQAQESVNPPEQIAENISYAVVHSDAMNRASIDPHAATDPATEQSLSDNPAFAGTRPTVAYADLRDDVAAWRRNFRQNLSLLLVLTLAAFTLTIWILVRVDSPFGAFSNGPQEIVRAQLRALDRGELRPAYDMFSERYRGQVSFDDWHHLIVSHWRMFHAQVLGSGMPANSGPDVTLEIYLHSADDKNYRARFTLVRTDGRWWIDDVHWAEEPDQRNVSRT
jgi:hypothetical protein